VIAELHQADIWVDFVNSSMRKILRLVEIYVHEMLSLDYQAHPYIIHVGLDVLYVMIIKSYIASTTKNARHIAVRIEMNFIVWWTSVSVYCVCRVLENAGEE